MNSNDGISSSWPIAAASQIRVKVLKDGGSGSSYCRLYYNSSSGAIELVTCNEDEVYEQQPIYDDCNTNIEDEPFYKSYLKTSKDNDRTIIDSFHPSDVIGANLSLEYNMNNPNTLFGMKSYASAQYNIYTYPKSSKGIRTSCCHKQYIIDPKCCEDFSNAQRLIKAIQTISGLQNAQRSNPLKCLVILNPYSGGGGESSKSGAKNVYNTIVKPMLEQAGVEHDALVTQHGGHAKERMAKRQKHKSITTTEEDVKKVAKHNSETSLDNINTDTELQDITNYDAIIAMGGDGILFEIFQGIHARSDEQHIMSTMKFGILACGTFNGLVKSILHWSNEANYNHVESMMHICKGETFTLDVAKYNVLSKSSSSDSGAPIIKQSYTSFLSFAWGLIADCDFESECIRWVGHLRSDIWAVYRGVLFRRQYRAKFSYLPPENAPKNKDVVMPKLGQPLPEGWKTFDDDDFLVFWVCNTSHAAHNMFTCPVAKMNDGLFHVLIVR